METINVDYINPFISAIASIFKMTAGIECKAGRPYIRESPYTGGEVAIFIGITGDIKGQVIFTLSQVDACKIASGMMGGMSVPELDEMARSAISEATNMISGNAATGLSAKGITVDITPPTLLMGQKMQISTQKMITFCVPMDFTPDGKLEIDIAMSDQK